MEVNLLRMRKKHPPPLKKGAKTQTFGKNGEKQNPPIKHK